MVHFSHDRLISVLVSKCFTYSQKLFSEAMSSGRQRHRGGRHGNGRHGDGGDRRPREPVLLAADDTPVTAMFRGFAAQLDNKHDTYERLVKKSRDVTIESKRIIFMLHRVTRWAEWRPLQAGGGSVSS